MDVALDPEVERVLLAKVEAGEYPSVQVLFEEALFLLVERDFRRSQAELQDLMSQGKIPGIPTEGETHDA